MGLVIVGLVIVAVLTAACGGKNGTSQALSKQEYLAEGDKTCDALAAREVKPPLTNNAAEAVAYYDKVIALLEERESKLRALRAPVEDAEKIARIFATQDELIKAVNAARTLAGEGRAERGHQRPIREAKRKLAELRRDYGFGKPDGDDFTGCARGAYSREKAEFIAKGDAICAESLGRINALPPPVEGPLASVTAAKYAQSLVPALEEWKARFGALKPPSGGERIARDVMTSLDTAIAGFHEAGSAPSEEAAEAGYQKAAANLAEFFNPADVYGFIDCAGF